MGLRLHPVGYPIHRLRDEMDRVFMNALRELPFLGTDAAAGFAVGPPLAVWEEKETLFVEAELPGFRLEDVEILLHQQELTIQGSRRLSAPSDAHYHRRERGSGSFKRSLRLPFAVDEDKIAATLRDGVLLVSLPKAEAAKPRKIEVRAS